MIEEADHRMLRPHALQPHPPRSFFRRDPVWVARKLLGHRLVSGVGGTRTAGIIVETEAYLGIADKAAHTYGGRRSRRNRTMWGAAGHAYVYFVYGMHHCINVVAGETGDPVAVLIRALEPDAGIDTCSSAVAGHGAPPTSARDQPSYARRWASTSASTART